MRPILRLFDGYKHTSPQLAITVKELQGQLLKRGYRIRVDGEYNYYTESVVKLFQASKKLPATGICDATTWAVLLGVNPNNVSNNFPTTYTINDKGLLEEYSVFLKYKDIVLYLGKELQLAPAILAGIGSRESRWGLALTPPGPGGKGDKGNGFGLMQVDQRYHLAHTSSEDWSNPAKHLAYSAKYLKTCIDYFTTKTGIAGNVALQAGVAAYNCGPTNAINAFKQGQDIDYFTAGRNYSKDVFSRAGWYQLNGII
jgi:Putative peptidoglycan binding domain/Transglycosylase SLT domain